MRLAPLRHPVSYAGSPVSRRSGTIFSTLIPFTASGHITDDKPNAQPVYTVQEELESWEKIVSALTEVRTELHRIK
jgi:hypothetical protein